MLRVVAAISAVALALGLVAQPLAADAAVPGYDSSYAGESAFLSLGQGQTGTFTVFFANTGTTSWVAGSASQVDLAACRENKVTCNSQDSSEAPFNSGWLSPTRYATHTQGTVAPGQIATFTYNVTVPTNAAGGTYRFNGALVLAATGADIHNEGYFQDVTVVVSTAAPALTSISPASGGTAGGTTVTVAGSGFICTPTFPTISFGGTAGTVTGCGATSVAATTPARTAGTVNVTVSNAGSGPSNAVTFTYTDVAAPQFTSVAASGNTMTLAFNESVCRTGALLVGDISYSVNGGAQQHPQNVGGALTTSGLSTCSPNPPSGTSPSSVGAASFAIFSQAPFVNNDQVVVTLFNSSGRIVDVSGNAAPATTRAAAATADTSAPFITAANATGTTTIRLTYSERVFCNNAEPAQFSAIPSGGTVVTAAGVACDPGLAGGSGGSTTVTVSFLTSISPSNVGGTITYAQSGTAANRVKDMAGNDAASPQTINYSGFTPTQPTMVDTRIATSGGFGTQLDDGDAFTVAFSAKMNAASPGNIILRVRDGDGTTADISCATHATCLWNAATVTIGGVTYGSNEVLTVTLTTTPAALSGFAGSVPGIQLPATIEDAANLTDQNGLTLNFTGSPDRVIDIE